MVGKIDGEGECIAEKDWQDEEQVADTTSAGNTVAT